MPGMRRGDRRDANDDNARRNIIIPQEEPTSDETLHERVLKARSELASTKFDRDKIQSELEEKNQSLAEISTQLVHVQQSFQAAQSELEEKDKNLAEKSSQLVHIQQAFQTSQQKVATLKEESKQNHQLYLAEQQNYQQTLALYDQERAASNEWLAKYEAAEAQRNQYLDLYNEAQTQLKYERRSKAGIKGWETRRKQENQRLKQEIGELTVLVRESLSRKDEALENLSLFADRMDKIQTLVDSIEGESPDNPIGLLQKFKRIWISIKDILSE
jgi:chromosome segregation ATPase